MPKLLTTRVDLKFREEARHPGIGGNEIEVKEATLLGNTLHISVLWDGGYDDPWIENWFYELSPRELGYLQDRIISGEDYYLPIGWVRLDELDPDFKQPEDAIEPEDLEYGPKINLWD